MRARNLREDVRRTERDDACEKHPSEVAEARVEIDGKSKRQQHDSHNPECRSDRMRPHVGGVDETDAGYGETEKRAASERKQNCENAPQARRSGDQILIGEFMQRERE